MSDLAERWLARPKRTAALVLLAVVAALLGLKDLRADMDARSFFTLPDDQALAFEHFQESWGRDEGLVFGVLALDELDLRAVEDVAGRLAEVDGVQRVHAASRELRAGLRVGGLALPTPLFVQPHPAEELLADRHLVPRLLSEDGSHAALFVWLDGDLDDPTSLRPVVSELTEAAGDAVVLGGMPVVRAGLLEVILVNQAVLGPVVVVGVVALLVWWYRRPDGVLLPLTAALLPPALLLGVMGWTGEPLGILNQVYFTLLPVLAVADAIHLLGRYHEELGRGVERKQAVVTALQRVGAACVLTTVTTAVGLGSLVAAPMPLLVQFGLFGAVGVVLAWFAFIGVLPLLLLFGRSRGAPGDRLSAPLDRVGRAALGRPGAVLIGAAVCLLVSLAVGSQATVDARYTDRLPADHPSTLAARLAEAELGGAVDVPFELRRSGGLMSSEVLDALGRAEARLLAEPLVRAVDSPARAAARLSLAGGGPDVAPDDAERLLRFPGPWRDEGREGVLALGLEDAGAVATTALLVRVQEVLEAELGPLGVAVAPQSSVAIFYESMLQLSDILIRSLGVAFLACVVLIGLLFRSARLAAIAAVVNAVPVAVGLAVVGAHGWRLDALSAVVFTLGVGVCVDDTIHWLVRYREERQLHAAADAARRAIVGAGGPMVVTTLILAAGLGVNALSTFPHNQVFAWLGASMVLAALPCDLVLLPALVVLSERARPAPSRSPRATAVGGASRT